MLTTKDWNVVGVSADYAPQIITYFVYRLHECKVFVLAGMELSAGADTPTLVPRLCQFCWTERLPWV
jgi:hypothetical protein